MGLMTKKYRVWISFYPKLVIFSKTVGQQVWILSEILICFKTHKNSYTGLLCINDLQYGIMTKRYRVLVSVCPKLVIFGKTVG
jgi:hypothetical protein